jgi:glycosyltransferase involved in cell wall biosynthesis
VINRNSPISTISPVPVLHLIVELSIGGAQIALRRLLSHLDRQRFKPQVACFYNGDGAVAREIRANGVLVTDLGMAGKYRLDAFWRLNRLLRDQHPAILHTWMFHANIPGRLIGRTAGVPVIITSERTMGQEGNFRRWLNRSTARWANSIVCVSQSVADFAIGKIGLPAKKIVVIPNGIELDQFENLPIQSEARVKYQLPEGALIIGAIGRPRAVKGYSYLIDAFARLAQGHPSAHLLFVGDGPDRSRLEEQVQTTGFIDRVTFLADQLDIPSLLPALDILALPSLHEGMPNVAIEAMAAGLPVVATAVGGTPEVIIDGINGLLVPPRNPEALAGALSRLLLDPDLRQRMGQAGRQRAFEQFNIQHTVQQTQVLYESLIYS